MKIGQAGAWAAVLLAVACTQPRIPVATPNLRSDFTASVRDRPPAQAPGACWHGAERPALFETVTEQLLVSPERRDATGALVAPAVFRTETRQSEVRPRQPVWFEVPCPDDGAGDPVFVASLQRALKARGFYDGPVSGMMNAETDTAVLRYQGANGLDNAVLSMAAARALGLVKVTD